LSDVAIIYNKKCAWKEVVEVVDSNSILLSDMEIILFPILACLPLPGYYHKVKRPGEKTPSMEYFIKNVF